MQKHETLNAWLQQSQGSVFVWIETNLSLFGEASFMVSCLLSWMLRCYALSCDIEYDGGFSWSTKCLHSMIMTSWPFHKITLRHSHNSRLNQWGRKLSNLRRKQDSIFTFSSEQTLSDPTTSELWFLWDKMRQSSVQRK